MHRQRGKEKHDDHSETVTRQADPSRASRHWWHPQHPGTVLAAIMGIHTLAWFSIEPCMIYLLYARFAKRSNRHAALEAVRA